MTPQRAQWAERRRQIEVGRYWIGPDGPRGRWRKLIFSSLLALFGWGLRLMLVHGRGRRNALDLRLRKHEIVVPGLPSSFDGYRILHVSDTHLDTLPELADVARTLLADVEVDLLALTGDIRGRFSAPIELSAGLLGTALSSLRVRDRRLAILGNHDPVEMVGTLERSGYEVLVNESTVLRRDEQKLRITGLDDAHFFYTPATQAALEAHDGECRIALVHSGEMADHAAAAGYALYLCGHTHGGQIALPGGRPIVSQLTRCRHAAAGLWRDGAMIGHTSSGLGVSPPIVRFNTRGEAALLTLRCTSPA